MQQFVVFLLLVAAVVAVPRSKRDLFPQPEVDKLPELMKNDALVTSTITCVKDKDETHAQEICDKNGKVIRAHWIKIVKDGDCTACTEKDKSAIVFIIDHLQKNRPEDVKAIETQYGITAEHKAKFDEWRKTVKPLVATP